ncbi:MAG: hypothetical protein ACRDK3_16945 [Actinomycetota bacterium]
MWRTRAVGAALAALLSLPAGTSSRTESPETPGRTPQLEPSQTAPLSAYEGLASWVDMYDRGPWRYPQRTARRMAARGTKTLFLQTSNYRKKVDVYRPATMSRLLEAAHARGMKVVAWYLPSYAHPKRDWRRTKAALQFQSVNGQGFDGFAMDIEATVEPNIATRNRRMIALSDRLRSFVGDDYALGAIIPDPVTQQFWPSFPYKKVGNRYDAFLPMAYWTYRTGGTRRVYNYTRDALKIIRSKTGDSRVPIHVIGGIASAAPVSEVRSFAKAAVDFRARGASLYDFPITSSEQWDQMQRINK